MFTDEALSSSPTPLSSLQHSPPGLSFSKQALIDAASLASATAQPREFDTPIYLLPTELVAGIFAICHETEEEDYRDSATRCSRVIISHVCSRWRAVILSMPSLWSTISVRGPRGSSHHRLEAHLERSAMFPLSLHFVSNLFTAEQSVGNIKDNMVLTIVHAQRWKSVQLHLTYEHARPILDVLQSTSFPSLESLDLNIQDWPLETSNAIFEALSADSSSIRKLSWRGPGGMPPSPCWATLTHLEVGNAFSLREIYTLLSRCRDVVELHIYSIRDSGEGPLHAGAVITLDKLEVLSVFTREPLEDLFDRLCLPRLKQLELRYLGSIPAAGRPSRAIDTFLARSKCSLEEFLLRDTCMPSEALDQLLRMPNFDTVRDLSIQLPPLDDRVLATLTRSVDGEGLLPQLQIFSFWRSHATNGTLGDMLTSRFQGSGQNLQCLRTAIRATAFCLRDRQTLNNLKARGMDIVEYGGHVNS
ncbi:hypothetical protein HGRIS_000805 [Hohenbuehelia grisea]|uniref:F-box domain-containing protein n=1 Tax=Hohenbuehelia grisea TaxID=104357 RepID=A0ABR3IPX5_9AGAR